MNQYGVSGPAVIPYDWRGWYRVLLMTPAVVQRPICSCYWWFRGRRWGLAPLKAGLQRWHHVPVVAPAVVQRPLFAFCEPEGAVGADSDPDGELRSGHWHRESPRSTRPILFPRNSVNRGRRLGRR
jgi:hypothetical protein